MRGLAKHFGPVTALQGLDLSLAAGQVVGLLGENGCGKTTLLKILAGVMAGYTGEVLVAGHHPGPESPSRWPAAPRWCCSTSRSPASTRRPAKASSRA